MERLVMCLNRVNPCLLLRLNFEHIPPVRAEGDGPLETSNLSVPPRDGTWF